MPLPACSAPIAPTLMMRPAPDESRYGIAAREAFNAVVTLSAYMRCQVLGSPSATVSKAKPPAMLISTSSLPKCEAAAPMAFLAWARVGEVDAAEFEQVGGRRDLRWRVINARNFGAPRQRFLHHTPAERAQRARHHDHFSIHDGPPHPGKQGAQTSVSRF